MICMRCGAETRVHSCSYYSTEDICGACKDEERQLPTYDRARAAEEAACRAGNYNFSGIGLTADDWAQLRTLRAQRKGTRDVP